MAVEPASPVEPPQPPSRGALSLRIVLALVVIVVIAGGVALLTTASPSKRPSVAGIQGIASAKYAGSLASPPAPEFPLSLRNYKGQQVNIDQYKGKAVLLTFLYTHCPDVCPIIASNLAVALNMLGPAKAAKVQVIAVSVDPRGDTPAAVATFLQRHDMTGRMQYLIGSAKELTADNQGGPASDATHLGLTVRPLTPDEREQAGVPSGLVVEDAQGRAAEAGIQQGDVVLSVNGTPVKTVAELRELVHQHSKQIALLIQRGDDRIFVPVALG